MIVIEPADLIPWCVAFVALIGCVVTANRTAAIYKAEAARLDAIVERLIAERSGRAGV